MAAILRTPREPDKDSVRWLRIRNSENFAFRYMDAERRWEMVANRPCPLCDTIGIVLLIGIAPEDPRGREYWWQCHCGDWIIPGDEFERLLERRDIH